MTTPRRSRMEPNMGLDTRTTTAFCTVERVMSISLTRRDDVAIWRLHLEEWECHGPGVAAFGVTYDMPNRVLGFGMLGTRWKYE